MIDHFSDLKLENITYSYPNAEKPAVRNISLELRFGESIAFVGATGCGKSTLVNLMLGLLEPHIGRITVNGVDVFKDMDGWRTQLGYIPQTIYLVDDTIRANVAFGIPKDKIDERHVWKALRSARLEKFVKANPKGLDSIVGERGIRLSGGERQRLGIARALYTDPKILVMDEATSALDNRTEEDVMQVIKDIRKKRTLILVAHRLSTVVDCDRLYFLSNGEIICSGSYDELILSSKEFRRMTDVNG